MPETRSTQFAFLFAAAWTIAAASQVIVGETMSTASPEGAVEVKACSAVSRNSVTSVLPAIDRPLLSPDEETNSDSFENDQARLDAAFDALIEQQAITDALVERPETTASVPDPSIDPTPRRQNFSLLAYYVFYDAESCGLATAL